jgi:hypothetical protein
MQGIPAAVYGRLLTASSSSITCAAVSCRQTFTHACSTVCTLLWQQLLRIFCFIYWWLLLRCWQLLLV